MDFSKSFMVSKRRILLPLLVFVLFLTCSFAFLPFIQVSATEREGEIAEMKQVELYQLAPDTEALMQSYVIKTGNGKLVVIDGGIGDANPNRAPYLLAALRAIAGVEENAYFEVEAWFISHAHKDHYYELAKMLNAYTAASNYKINQFYFDIPPFETPAFPYTDPEGETLSQLKMGLTNYANVNGIAVSAGSTYYDDLNSAVINATSVSQGLTINVDDVAFEVLQTWDVNRGSDANNQSLVIKMYACEQTVLFLNDSKTDAGSSLLKNCADKLKSDIVQTAHHGQDGVQEEVYNKIAAEVNLWPTPRWVWQDASAYTIGQTRKWLNGVDFTLANERNIVACLYEAYPKNQASVNDWAKVKDGMKIVLPYDWTSEDEETLRMPSFSVESGTHIGAQEVELSTIEEDAEIYYTTDGSFPTKSSTKYTQPIKVGVEGEMGLYNIRAVVIRGDERSKVATQEYFIVNGSRNIALNKPIKVVSYDMSEDWSDQVYSVNKMNKDGSLKEEGVDDVKYINDGSFDKYYVISTYHKYANGGKGGGNGVGWAVIDFGAAYQIDYIRYDAYWDWQTYNHIIQLANNPDFSDAVTVYENPERIMTGKVDGKQTNGMIIEVNQTDKYRYLRVSNASTNHSSNPMSVFTEIQAYNKCEQLGTDLLSDSTQWEVTSGGTWVHENGVVQQTNPANTSNWTPSYTYKAKTYKNFVLDATIKMDITNASQWGYIGFGLYKPNVDDDVNDVNHGFYAAIEPKGRVLLWNGEKELSSASVKNFVLSSAFTMRIMSFEDRVTILINGQPILYARGDIFDKEAGYISIHSGLIPITVSSLRIDEISSDDFSDFTYQENIVKQKNSKETVDYGRTYEQVIAMLPSTTSVNDTGGNTHTVGLSWSCVNYDGNKNGWYTFVGEYTDLPEGLINVYEFTLEKMIFVCPQISVELQELLIKIEDMNAAMYTADSMQAVESAKQAVENVLAQDYPMQADVDSAFAQLVAAEQALVIKVDFTALKATVDAAKDVDLDKYVSNGKFEFRRALSDAEELLFNYDVAQADVDAANAALETAQGALVAKGDKSALKAAISATSALVEATYTAETWTALVNAKTAAETVVANDEATQADVDAAKTALEAAQAALVEKPEESSGCGSTMSVGALVMCAGLGVASLLKKKKEDNE